MDWDDFMKIPGCVISHHSDVKLVRPKVAPNVTEEQPSRVEPTQILDPAPLAPVPVPIAVAQTQVPYKAVSGLLKCRHAGCMKEYDPDLNDEGACEYHEGTAGFRDTKKFWTCCGASSYDWDEFMKIPKCKTGRHEPKMVDA
jgi:hypothetical protein